MATEQQLAAKVDQLRAAVEALAATTDAKVDARVAEVSVPRKELRKTLQRWWVAGLLIMLLVVGASVITSRVTLLRAQDHAIGDFRRLVSICRTTGPPLSPEDLAFCNRRVPGFDQARARVLATAATAKRNQERLDRVERELAKLKH